MDKKVALLILDGLGIGGRDSSDAVHTAKTPHLDQLWNTWPHATLEASGEAVGLPAGQMGNSEVGHMNLGAGRIVYQELGRINKAVEEGRLLEHPVLVAAFQRARQENKNIHLLGLLSDGGVHSHINHLIGLCEAAAAHGLSAEQVNIHAFLDGRDTDPRGGLLYLQELNESLQHSAGRVVSLIGRYYAMDRDHRWERIKQAYDLLVHGIGKPSRDLEQSIQESYDQGVTDEFLLPVVRLDETGRPMAVIQEGDVVICFNFRTDRGRQISMALHQQDYPDWQMQALPFEYITMTAYDDTFQDVAVLFEKEHLHNTLGEVLEHAGKSQTRIAETEKYPHVTFFFSGGRETAFNREHRIMIPSPQVATYDLQPSMSAGEIATAIINHIHQEQPDFICLNFANPDMVGHTGVYQAVVEAVETVDRCLGMVTEACLAHGYRILVLADHGNADFMVNEDGSPNTAHTTNLVPFIVVDPEVSRVKNGKLGDVAPTILNLMNLAAPLEMTGQVLIER